MLRPRHGMVDPRRLTSRTFAPLLYAITRQPSSFSSFARARAAEGLGDCHNALRANSIPAGFLACPHVLDHTSPGRLVSAHGSDFLPPRPLGGSGMTCPRCQQDNPSHAKFCLACGVPLRRTSESGPSGMSYVQMQGALTEALEQQTATSEVLKVISRSAFDLQPVLETLLENAARLCAAEWGVIFRPDGDAYRMAAVYGASAEFKEFLTRTPIPPGRGSGVGRAALERRPVQVADVSADPEYRVTEFQRIGGFRTVLAVPMLREGVLLGVFGLHRYKVRPFTEKQIQLVSTFADQAAIAIENVRLFNETKEALEQQTATAEILRVISQSPTDVQPVFDAIAESVVQLCDSVSATVYWFDGHLIHLVAHHH